MVAFASLCVARVQFDRDVPNMAASTQPTSTFVCIWVETGEVCVCVRQWQLRKWENKCNNDKNNVNVKIREMLLCCSISMCCNEIYVFTILIANFFSNQSSSFSKQKE